MIYTTNIYTYAYIQNPCLAVASTATAVVFLSLHISQSFFPKLFVKQSANLKENRQFDTACNFPKLTFSDACSNGRKHHTAWHEVLVPFKEKIMQRSIKRVIQCQKTFCSLASSACANITQRKHTHTHTCNDLI